ncbi:Dynein heavy chain 2, axonemal [Lamellibrachia satsuma]|nr:Dynein heavy chain 2, axonemal [Lamellibrachia satsuma]
MADDGTATPDVAVEDPKSGEGMRTQSSPAPAQPEEGEHRSSAGDNGSGEVPATGGDEPTYPKVEEVEPEIEGPSVTVEEFLRARLILSGLREVEWTDIHSQAITDFGTDQTKRILVAFIDPINGLVMQHKIPVVRMEEMMYFIKGPHSPTVTSDNFLNVVQYGKVTGGHIQSLLRQMMGIYAPVFFENKTWPDSIKNDFSAQLHKFLASLTDTRWKMEGKTVLYIPGEGLKMSPELAARDKELIQRLETAMIHWTRQIKEVLNAQDSLQTSENAGPMEEIDFWKNRCADLSGISDQLDKLGVKRITEILQLAKSSYVNAFLKLSGQIKEGSYQAQSNLKFLLTLKDPCHDLSEAHPKDIPNMLPKILSLIRMIWVNSEFYTTRERLTGLLRKLSNEIIRRCSKEINLERIFSGYVESSSTTLNECINCCEQWKEVYSKMSKLHHRYSPNGWVLDKSSVFAQIDAFVQRCRDLLEVCDAQTQFARMGEGKNKEMPHFAGQRGPEIVRALLEIEAVFMKNLSSLSAVRKTILEVKATTWHEDYNRFRAGLKDLEVMMQNAITSAFETVTTVEQGVEVLDVFMHLSSREAIRRTLDKKTVDVYTVFNDELNAVKKELTQKSSPLPPHHPKFAGQAHWARMLKKRIERSMMAHMPLSVTLWVVQVLDRAYFLPRTGSGDETRTQYQGLCQALEEYMRKTFYDWTLTVDKEPMKLLEVPLMCRSQEKPGMIDINFDKALLKLFAEIHYWERMMFEIPHYASEVYAKGEDLRNQREHVLLVVRDYNRIIAALSQEERGLFKERIRFLDKKIYLGLTKLTWVSKGMAEYFINECRIFAGKVQAIVDSYKTANMQIATMCRTITQKLLIKVDEKRVYENLEFDDAQRLHREHTQQKLRELHEDIVTTMRQTYEVFKNDPNEVQQHWRRYAEKMDKMVEEACRLNIKWSLQELSRAINGDGKSAPNPLFKVKVILEGDKVEFSPTLKQLATIVCSKAGYIINAIANIRRLPDLLTTKKSTKQAIHEVIINDEDIKKIQNQISTGMQANATNLQSYLSTWDNYREIWEINKDAFIRRYQKLNPQVSSFEADIARYTEVANNVQVQETILNIQFVLLDCSPLKFAILGHCQEWQNKFTSLLFEIATAKMRELHNYLVSNAQNVTKPPNTLDELGQSLELWEQLNNDRTSTESQFQPLNEQFEIMMKYEVLIPDDVQDMFDNLNKDWEIFQQSLVEAEVMLKKHKEKFKTGLLAQSEDFKKQVNSLMEEFHSKGPFSSAVTSENALALIKNMRDQLQGLKDQEQNLRRGLGIFKIDQPPSKDITRMEHELDQLQAIWELTLDWESHWDDWKTNSFSDLQTEAMEEHINNLFRKLNKFSRELKDKNWEILETSKAKVDQFRRTMPLVSDLKNNAMRPRHWDQIQNEMNKTFNPDSENFTLERIIEYGFDQYAEKINEISGAATKELQIEKGISEIANAWESIILEMDPHKDKGHYKIKSTEELFIALEDNQVKLSTMKASRFVKAFEHDVDYWERTLSHIMEVVELLLTIQRQWMYLDNIFLGEDIRRQLPGESSDFDDINNSWKYITSRLNDIRNALRGTTEKGLYEKLNDMNAKLEEIQKSLDMYLETKRQIFPRFYFLSNDDLLEILGQSKNPEAVQPHLKKCFDNIKSLIIIKTSLNNPKFDAQAMTSSDGETVPFIGNTALEGPVEAWLCDIEKNMRLTLKEQLKGAKNSLRRMLNKRDKWVKEYPGQMCLTAGQIQWTADVTKALGITKERGDKKALKTMKKKQVAMLSKFSEAIRSNLTKIQRLKIVAIVTVEVHARDIIEKLIKTGCNDITAFEWLSQLRLYWDRDIDDCIIKQTNTQFQYGYEYLGNSGRLVITPLTDRCYMTLTTALHLHRGGSPKGPAGTGKTETTKDLGKSLGSYVIVVNCSEGLDYKSMGRMFSGLAQTGAWGCFDEFNRINIEVLSVVAQQILSILSALAAGSTRFVFEGREIRLEWSCGMFITMNPGYAGRTELPDNLKSMFRPISMVVPDSTLIAEIILFGEGFSNTKHLAKKVYTFYSLAIQQLSKQDHYDFGLRALVSVLRYAGRKKRICSAMADEEVLLLSLKDMNIAKLTSGDLPLFYGIVQDLFPGIESPVSDYTKLKAAINAELGEAGLQPITHTMSKVIQLYETKSSRHSVMIVGQTQSGKTVSWRVLMSVMTRLAKDGDPNFQVIKDYPLNPKALSLGELYGEFDLNTNEWTDGVLSSIMRQTCSDEKLDEKWLIFDGPVDTLWIESMNSVMDDNKVLTLINGERISMPDQVLSATISSLVNLHARSGTICYNLFPCQSPCPIRYYLLQSLPLSISMPDQVSMLFEVEDLKVASPATVSRCGMVYYDYVDLGWKPYIFSWLETKKHKNMIDELKRLIDKYIEKLMEFTQVSHLKELVPIAELNSIISFCHLFDVLAVEKNGVDPNDSDNFPRTIEMWFIFCIIWSICAPFDEDSRKKIDNYIREVEGAFPNKDSIYEYIVEPKLRTWQHWEERLRVGWRFTPGTPFYKIIVPTVDTIRYNYLVMKLVSAHHPVMMVGPVGTGKTSVAHSVLHELDPHTYSSLTVNMSAQTSSNDVQSIIESRVEKRTKGVYVPLGGRKMVTFMDDFNMPAKDMFGSQPPLELIRLWLDYGFWYNRTKQTMTYIRDMFILVAMGPPGGGRMVISRRLQSRFNLINMTFPNESQIKRIFGTMINQNLQDFEEELKPIGDVMTEATIDMYNAITARFLPTPAKIHYLFNLRDISRIFQGLMRIRKTYHDTRVTITRLWIHECFRVFSDRLNDSKDNEAFVFLLSEKLAQYFDQTYHNICPNRQPPIFGKLLTSQQPKFVGREHCSDFHPTTVGREHCSDFQPTTVGREHCSDFQPTTVGREHCSDFHPTTVGREHCSDFHPTTVGSEHCSDFHPTTVGREHCSDFHPTTVGREHCSDFQPTTVGREHCSDFHPTTVGREHCSDFHPTTVGREHCSDFHPTTVGSEHCSDFHPTTVGREHCSDFHPTTVGREHFSDFHPTTVGDFMRTDSIYEDIQDIDHLKKFMMETLDEYNNMPGVIQMDLVLFRDAIEHGALSQSHSHTITQSHCYTVT